MENKVHVMCEKPAGVYTKAVDEMNAVAAKMAAEGVVFGIMFNQRTNCIYRKMKEIIESGELGEIRRTNWIITNWFRSQQYYDSGDWRATWSGEGGGVLVNQSPHQLDLWQWICGMPKKITAFCKEGLWHDIEVEDDVTAYAEYENGATGVFITTTGDYPGTNRFEVTLDKGVLITGEGGLKLKKLEVPTSEMIVMKSDGFGGRVARPENIEVETDGHNPQHKGVLRAFTQKILGKGEMVADGRDGINGVQLSNAMHLSSWLGRTVELPVDGELFYSELSKRIAGSRRPADASRMGTGEVADLSNTY
jgi:predicted dehydrogenase